MLALSGLEVRCNSFAKNNFWDKNIFEVISDVIFRGSLILQSVYRVCGVCAVSVRSLKVHR